MTITIHLDRILARIMARRARRLALRARGVLLFAKRTPTPKNPTPKDALDRAKEP